MIIYLQKKTSPVTGAAAGLTPENKPVVDKVPAEAPAVPVAVPNVNPPNPVAVDADVVDPCVVLAPNVNVPGCEGCPGCPNMVIE